MQGSEGCKACKFDSCSCAEVAICVRKYAAAPQGATSLTLSDLHLALLESDARLPIHHCSKGQQHASFQGNSIGKLATF